MTDCKSSRENAFNWILFSTKEIILLIAMVFTFMSPSNPLEAESISGENIDCSTESDTCTKCTNKMSQCSWSVELQSCTNTRLLRAPWLSPQLIVRNETHCPRFTVVNKSSVAGASFKYTVRISNDAEGAVAAFFNRTTITCCIESCDFRGSVVGDSIVCAAVRTPWSYFADGARALISYIYVTIGDKKLQFDDDADHYYTIYDRDCAATSAADDCATCLWNDGGFKHYLKWCPSGNPCTGSYRVYDRRDADGDKKFLYAADDDVVRIRCAEFGILSVRPLYALRTGGGTTTMAITVRNHRMLADNRTVTVAVAGRRCEDPVTLDDQTITCSVGAQSSVAATAVGPVEVVYAPFLSSSSSRTLRFALRSSETVDFVDPEATSVRPTCGPASGGTMLTVRGRFLDAGNAVRVFIVADAVGETPEVGETVLMTCDTVSRDRHTIVCWTAAAARRDDYNASGSLSARVKVQFDGGPIKYVQSPTSWTLCSSSDAAALDAGQVFAGTVSGGTVVPVRGVRFTCVADPQFYVHDKDGVRHQHIAGCLVVNDTYMECRSPDMRRVPSAMAVTIAEFPDFGVWARDCAGEVLPSDLPVLSRPQQQRLSETAVRSPFSVYADPVYVDFEIRNGTVVISGGRPSSVGLQGFTAGDVVVRFRNSTGGCHVTSVSRYEIVCWPTSTTTATVVDQLRYVVVTVGGDDGYACDVQKKSITDDWNSGHGGQSLLFTDVTFSCCRGVAIISAVVLLFAVGVLLLRVISKNRYVISAET